MSSLHLVFLLVLQIVWICSDSQSPFPINEHYPSNGCSRELDDDIVGSTRTYTFEDQGYTRTYMVHVPVGWEQDSSSGHPLVIGLHGYTGTAADFQEYFEMDPHSDSNNYLAVYFQATSFVDPNNGSYPINSWNDGPCGFGIHSSVISDTWTHYIIW